jgi:probable HAF family extracellular repeat protein
MACVAFQASARNFATIDFPGANATEPFAINSNGDIVGTYSDSGPRGHGFLLHSGTFTTLDFPGADITEPTGINVNRAVVGTYFAATTEHGFLWHNGTFTTIDAPGATGTFAEGINDLGDIVGFFTTGSASHGFLLRNGTFTNLDAPFSGRFGLAETFPWGINSHGDIVGGYIPFQPSIGFFLHAGVWNSISVGGADITFAREINSQGDIAGSISDDIGFHGHGFVFTTRERPVKSTRGWSAAPVRRARRFWSRTCKARPIIPARRSPARCTCAGRWPSTTPRGRSTRCRRPASATT